MPASMMGYLVPSSLHSGVLRGGGDDMMKAGLQSWLTNCIKKREQCRQENNNGRRRRKTKIHRGAWKEVVG